MLFRNATKVDFLQMDIICVDNGTFLLMQVCVLNEHLFSFLNTLTVLFLHFVTSAHLYNSGVFLLAVNELSVGKIENCFDVKCLFLMFVFLPFAKHK